MVLILRNGALVFIQCREVRKEEGTGGMDGEKRERGCKRRVYNG